MNTLNDSGGYPPGRIVSIDALRGFDMFLLIGGFPIVRVICKVADAPWTDTVMAHLRHTPWHGFHLIDLIFPLFLFLAGASMSFSFKKRLERGDSRAKLYLHVIKRCALLLLLGLIYNGLLDFDFSRFYYTGVLQRIAVSYFVAAVVVMNTGARGQTAAAAGLLLLYWALMMFVPVPEHGAGILTPEGNMAGYIDRLFLPGRFHRDLPYDEDGILSQIPSTANVLIGVLAGHWLGSSASARRKVLGLLAAGPVAVFGALAWDAHFPIIFRLWTSSYALLTAGISLMLLGLFYCVVDVMGYRKWAFPLVVIGLNPLTIYVAQRLFDFGIIADIFVHGFIHHFGDFEPIAWALCVFLVEWVFLYFLYRQKIFLRV